jgi:hypothetical protein
VPMHLIAHEDVLIFAKGTTSASSGELKRSQRHLEWPPRSSSQTDPSVHTADGRSVE